MAEAFNPYRFLWWRFSSYELKDGYIRPAPGAKLALYDPWKPYRDSWENDPDSDTPFPEKRLQGPPYLSLLALADELKQAPSRLDLDKKSADRLLKWCAEFGLLGILPQRVRMVTVAPRWLPELAWMAMFGHKVDRPKGSLLYPTQFTYHRDNSVFLSAGDIKVQGWHTVLMCGVEQGQRDKRLGQVCKANTGLKPGVLIQDMRFHPDDDFPSVIMTPTLYQESFNREWSRFFPTIPKKEQETYLYPPPLSQPFWDIYSESVSDFFMGVFALRDAILALNQPPTQFDPKQPSATYLGFNLMNNLVSSSSMVLGTNPDGSYRQEWRAASLLGCFAMMALQDLTQQRKVLACERCSRLFVTEAYQARYCSDRCRHTAQKRRYRQKLKEEKDNG